MNNFIKNFIIIILILIVIILLLNLELERYSTEPPHYRLQYKELTKSSNHSSIIILGTSHATHGIRPSLLSLSNKSVYNFALNGSNPEFYYKWYINLFKKYYKKPEIILFCVDWYMFDGKWLVRKYEHDSEYFPVNVFLKNLLNTNEYDIKTLLLNRYPVIKYRSRKDIRNIIVHEPNKIYTKEDYDRGYIHFENPNHGFNNIARERINLEQVDFFKKLIKQFYDDGIDIIFIDIPEYGPLINYLNLKSYKILNELQTMYDIPMLNYDLELRSNLNNDKKYYTDWGHLNREGSVHFSVMLNKDLNELLINENQ